MPFNPTVEAWVSSQMSLFWSYIANEEVECVLEDGGEQAINDLIALLHQIAMDEYLACKARETALSLYAGFPVDLGCVAP